MVSVNTTSIGYRPMNTLTAISQHLAPAYAVRSPCMSRIKLLRVVRMVSMMFRYIADRAGKCVPLLKAHITPISSQTPIPHRLWQVGCTLQWSLMSGHQHVCKSYHKRHQRRNWRKTRMEDVANLINICHTNPIQVLNLHRFFEDFVCVLHIILWQK